MKIQSSVIVFEGQGKSENLRQPQHALSLATQNTILDILSTGAARG